MTDNNGAATMAGRFTLPYLRLHVELDDGRTWDVDTDQRDQRTAMTDCGVRNIQMDAFGFTMACAWAALTRQGLLDGLPWLTFARNCRAAVPWEDQPALDPTQTAGDG